MFADENSHRESNTQTLRAKFKKISLSNKLSLQAYPT